VAQEDNTGVVTVKMVPERGTKKRQKTEMARTGVAGATRSEAADKGAAGLKIQMGEARRIKHEMPR
jgi:hypothetical protein